MSHLTCLVVFLSTDKLLSACFFSSCCVEDVSGCHPLCSGALPPASRRVCGLYKTTVARLQSCLCLSLLRLVCHKELQVFCLFDWGRKWAMQTHRQGMEVNSGEHKCLCFRYICKKKNKNLAGGVQVWDPLFLLLSHTKKSGKSRVISQIHCFVFSNAARSLH